MATATFAISNVTEGESWNISMSGLNFSTPINLLSYYSVYTTPAPPVILNDAFPGFIVYITSIYSSNGGGAPYFTWREYNWNTAGRREFGHSLDLWSSDLYTDIVTNNFTWSQINNRTYNLSNDRYSLLYYYTYNATNKSAARPTYWSKGGILTVNVV
jgi:hypothetical protein